MSKFITELQVSRSKAEAIPLQNEGLHKIPDALNKGTGGENIYLWYNKGDQSGITRIQFSYDKNTSDGMNEAGFTQIDRSLLVGSELFLWFQNESSESKVPITQICTTSDPKDGAEKMKSGWEPLACDVYWWWGMCTWGPSVKWIRLWVKREKQTYIKQVMATNHFGADDQHFKDGYIRLDENTNRGINGKPVYIWYLPTTDPAEAIRDLQVSTNDEEFNNIEARGYKVVDQDLNEGTGGNPVYLWYKEKDANKKPIQSMTLISTPEAVEKFQIAGVKVIKEDLNSGNGSGINLQLVFYH